MTCRTVEAELGTGWRAVGSPYRGHSGRMVEHFMHRPVQYLGSPCRGYPAGVAKAEAGCRSVSPVVFHEGHIGGTPET